MAISGGSKVFLVLVVLVIGLVGGGLAYTSHLLGGEAELGEPVGLAIAGSAASIGDQLEQEGVIRSALAFRLVARSKSLDGKLVAGQYEFQQGMSVDQAIDVLLGGPAAKATLRFTLPEGWTVAQTLERLANATEHSLEDFQAVLDAGPCRSDDQTPGTDCGLVIPPWVPDFATFGPEVRQPYEGLFFPETYDVVIEATPRQILQRLIDQLDRVVDDAVAEAGSDVDLYRTLIVASMIERETRADDERPIVASVIENRLAIPMRLQIDATAIYASGKHTNRVLISDTEIESPYNTYFVAGLPPTPIAAPGKASIRAALAPDTTDFLYYVVDVADGCNSLRHVFARTLDEHNRNVAKYRECQ